MARKAGCRRSVEEIMESISKRYPLIMAHLAKAEQAEATRIGPGPDRPEAHAFAIDPADECEMVWVRMGR